MPRQRTPIDIAEANGAKQHDPARYVTRRNAPQPEGPLGDAPNHFEDDYRDLWNEVVRMVPPGVLTSADRLLVEITCELLYKLRQRYIKPVEMGHLRACLGSMGLTPADRSRVTPTDEPKEEEDELDGYVQ